MSDAEVLNQTAQNQLRSFIERAENLEREKAEIAEQITGLMSEAKSSGYQPKIIRKVLKLRKMSPPVRAEEETLTDIYMHASGGAA